MNAQGWRGTTSLVIPVLAFATSNYRTSKKKNSNKKTWKNFPFPVPQASLGSYFFFHFLEGVEETCVVVSCRYFVHQNGSFFFFFSLQ